MMGEHENAPILAIVGQAQRQETMYKALGCPARHAP